MYRDIRGVMVKFPFVAGPDMRLADAEAYMKDCNIRHLPIVQDNRVVGLISDRDIQSHKEKSNYDILLIGEVIAGSPFIVTQAEPLTNVLDIMIRNKYGSAIVVNTSEEIVGIFTTIDAIRLLKNLISGEEEKLELGDHAIPLRQVVAWN